MIKERLTQVICAPHVSEKAALSADSMRQHVFKVLPSATKQEIKEAVEQLFNVKVENVRTMNVKGKVKRFGGRLGRRNHWKKAYVKLETGHDIDFGGVE